MKQNQNETNQMAVFIGGEPYGRYNSIKEKWSITSDRVKKWTDKGIVRYVKLDRKTTLYNLNDIEASINALKIQKDMEATRLKLKAKHIKLYKLELDILNGDITLKEGEALLNELKNESDNGYDIIHYIDIILEYIKNKNI